MPTRTFKLLLVTALPISFVLEGLAVEVDWVTAASGGLEPLGPYSYTIPLDVTHPRGFGFLRGAEIRLGSR